MFGGLHGGHVDPPADLRPPPPLLPSTDDDDGDDDCNDDDDRDDEPAATSLWIPQGGACEVAVPGTAILAREIIEFWESNGRGMPLSVCVPGGTCSTALLLHREVRRLLSEREEEGEGESEGEEGEGENPTGLQGRRSVMDVTVVVVPCVGDDDYARRQMRSLDAVTGGDGTDRSLPRVLTPSPNGGGGGGGRYLAFGDPSPEVLNTFVEMRDEHGIFLDLLYGGPAWAMLLRRWGAGTTGVGGGGG